MLRAEAGCGKGVQMGIQSLGSRSDPATDYMVCLKIHLEQGLGHLYEGC